jgi:hypothetical protein
MRAGGRAKRRPLALAAAVAFLGLAATVLGQDLEPRAYAAAPVGAHFLVMGLGYSGGSVLFDPSLPFTDVTARIGLGHLSYVQTFRLIGRSASLAVVLPYALGKMSGQVGEDLTTIHRSGFSDIRARLSMNLIGSRAMSPQEFSRRDPATTLGASLVVVAPTGQYDPLHLINIGTNRWAFKPELGLSQPIGHWVLDLAAGVWLYTDNTDFNGGQRRSQAALLTTQGHVSYTVRPGLWLSAGATFYAGGRTSVNGVEMQDRLENFRTGLMLAIPIAKAYALKFSWSTGVVTRIGGNFTAYMVAFQYRWFSH